MFHEISGMRALNLSEVQDDQRRLQPALALLSLQKLPRVWPNSAGHFLQHLWM